MNSRRFSVTGQVISILLLAFVYVTCDDDENPNYAPLSFSVVVKDIMKTSALVTWTVPPDPDGDNVVFDVMINGTLVAEGITEASIALPDLTISTIYAGEVIARDGRGGITTTPFEFSTAGIITYTGNVVISNKVELTEFAKHCYSIVTGNVTIGINHLSGITTLEGLECLTEIKGDLLINFQIQSPKGLDNLSRVGGNFFIANESGDWTALSHLSEVSGDFSVWGPELVGFNNLVTVGGEFTLMQTGANVIEGFEKLTNVKSILIANHNDLQFIKGFNSIKTLQHLDMYHNTTVTSIDAFHNLETIAGFVRLETHIALETLSGFDKLTTAGESLSLHGNKVTSYSFPELQSVKRFSFAGHTSLTTVSIPKLKSVEDLAVQQSGLVNLNSFAGITHVTNIDISYNPALTSLSGLEQIKKLNTGGRFVVAGNNNLTNYCGASALINGSVFGDFAYVVERNRFNPTLSMIGAGNCSQ